MARLLFRDSQGREGTVELSPTETVYVGRGLECAIRTDDGMVSRRHSQIRMEGGAYVVEDLGSANGVYLNNTRVQKTALSHADVVQCGSLVIRFIDENAPQRTPTPVVQQQTPPAKKGGTMVLAKHDTGGGGFTPAPGSQGYNQPYTPASPSGPTGQPNYGQPVNPSGPTNYGGSPPPGYGSNGP